MAEMVGGYPAGHIVPPGTPIKDIAENNIWLGDDFLEDNISIDDFMVNGKEDE